MTVIYICDHKACDKCNNPRCKRTQDVTHAVNFEKIAEGSYCEKEQVHCKDCKHCETVKIFEKTTLYSCTRKNPAVDVLPSDYCSRGRRKDESG